MIPGSPLLATWHTDGTLRLYEMAGDVFVPLGVVGGLSHDTTIASPVPLLSWDLEIVNILRKASNAGQIAGYDSVGNLFASNAPGSLASQSRFAASRNEDFFAQWSDGIAQVRRLNHSLANYGSFPITNFGSGLNGKTALTFSASGRVAAHVYNNVGSQYTLASYAADPGDSTWPWQFNTPVTRLVATGTGPDILHVTNDDMHILMGTTGDSRVRVFRASDTVPLPDIPLSKPLRTVATAPFGRLIAVSTLDSGTYETTIYRKVGDLYQALQTITGLGSMLTFSADGTMLFDAARRLTYRWNPTTRVMDAVAGSMTNVTVGAATQAVSDHVPALLTVPHWYQAGVVRLAEQALVPADVKFTLLNSTMPGFDPSAATMTAAAGASEVTGGSWPAGGYNLADFDVLPTGTNMATWIFTNLQHLAMLSGMTFRAILLYEDTGAGIPLCRIDFQSDVTIPIDNRVEFVLENGLVTFTP